MKCDMVGESKAIGINWMSGLKLGDVIWMKNPKAHMNNVYHCIITGWEIRFESQKREIFYKTKNHGWVSEHLAAPTREEALSKSLRGTQ